MLTLHFGFDELVYFGGATVLCCSRADEQENDYYGTRKMFCMEGHDYSPGGLVCLWLRMMR
jgi:hypothetical protein